jgi:hypothetical protein
MENYADILEHELESAVEVKDKSSLHRYIQLLVENTIGKPKYSSDMGELKSDVRLIAERIETMQKQMNERFEVIDKRFETVDKRFDDMAGRFRMMFTFITVGFTVLTAAIMLIKFLV